MRRRDFVRSITGMAAAWPLAARAQQRQIPVIGYLSSTTSGSSVDRVHAFRQGLAETATLYCGLEFQVC